MVKPLLTVRDFRAGLSDEVTDAGELLRNYEFNISQGIVQRVSRFFDVLALMDERGEAPPVRGEGGEGGKGGVMGFGHKRNVLNLEMKPARRVAWEQQGKERIQKEAAEAARKAAEQDAKVAALESQVAAAAALKAEEQETMAALEAKVAAEAARKAEEQDKVAALEAKVAEMQVLAALCAALHPRMAHLDPQRPSRTSAHPRILRIRPPYAPSAFAHVMRPPHVDNMCLHHLSLLRRSKLHGGGSVHEPQLLATPWHELGAGARAGLWAVASHSLG